MYKKKRVLHMTPPDIKNGVYKYIFNHLSYMNKDKYQFGFLTRAADELRQSDEYKKYGFKVHSFNSTQRDNPKSLENEVRKVLKDYDIIHLHTSSWRGFLIEQMAMEMGMEKVIVHAHSSYIDIENPIERDKQIKEHVSYRESFSEKYATDFCACSNMAAEWLFGEYIPRERVKILPNAIDTKKYAFDIKKRDHIRKSMNFTGKFVIGNVGRYSYQKNQEFLIKCMFDIKKINPDIVLVCIGKGELKQEYMKLIEHLDLCNNVFLLDWQNNIEEYLQAFDLFCQPSRFEGLSISIVEAQAAGLPCIISSYISNEVALTPLVQFLPLEQEIWVNNILYYANGNMLDRFGYNKNVADKGYDLEYSAKILEQLYDK